MKILYFALLLLFLFSCSNVVNVDEYNQKTQEVLGLVEKGVKRAEMDLMDHELILAQRKDDKGRQSLNRMRSIQQNLLQSYIRLKEDFENSPYRQKHKISSKEKEYGDFNSHKKDFETRFEILDKQFDNYRSESNKLNAYLESKSIFKVNSQKMKDDFINSINQAKKEQLTVKNELMDYNVKLNQSSLDPKDEKKKKTMIQDLVKMVEKMENETFKLQRLFTASMKEVSQGVKFATPGMKAHNYLVKIQNHLKAIQIQVDEFNLTSKKLND